MNSRRFDFTDQAKEVARECLPDVQANGLRRTLGTDPTPPARARARPPRRGAPRARPPVPRRHPARAQDWLPVATPAALRPVAQRQHLLETLFPMDQSRRLA